MTGNDIGLTNSTKRKPEIDSFPFDCGFFENPIIASLAGAFGIKGEIVPIRLLIAVFRNGYFLNWREENKTEILAHLPGVSAGLFDQILDCLLNWGFFDKSLFLSATVLTSEDIQRRYFEARRSSLKREQPPPYLLVRWEDFFEKNCPEEEKEEEDNNKKKYLNNISSSSAKLPPKGGAGGEQESEGQSESERKFLKTIEECKKSEIWLEAVQKKFRLSREEILHELDDFSLDIRCKGISVSSPKVYFTGWLSRKQEKRLRDENNTTDKFSGRRGTEPTSKRRKGFKGTF